MSKGTAGGYDSDFDVENLHLIPQAKLGVLQQIGPLTVWEVNGSMIRDWIFIDFTEGGNTEAYPWMPPNEIWLDNSNASERQYVLLHEIVEYNLMKNKGMDYGHAHDEACRIEIIARRNPHKLAGFMAGEATKAGAAPSPDMGAKLAGFAKGNEPL